MKKYISYLIIFFLTSLSTSHSQIQYPPISPKWVFEPWVWEDAVNTKAATWDLINGYLNRDIPVGAVIIDSPWEAPSDNGYNTFVFDPVRYSQPEEFINSLNEKNIHVILWITGIMTTDCPLYQEALEHNYFINGGTTTEFWKGSGRASHIDFFNQDAVAYWRGLMDRILNNYNVDGWKVDESDYYLKNFNTITTAAGNKTPKEYSEAYYSEMYNYTHFKRGNNGMIAARPYCDQHGSPYWFAPISVNTAGWVGDQQNSWDGLLHVLKNIFISSDAGYAAVGSDIGGYADDLDPDKTLFLRWAQLGALVPIMENGGPTDACHKPWLFDDSTVGIYRYFANLHHELVPYLYSYDIAAHLTGTSILRPFGSTSPDAYSWIGDWKYLLGDNLFVAAIYQDNTSRTITFPEGSWINYWDEEDIHQGGTTTTFNYSLDQYPVFIRSGAIIPMNVDHSVTGHGSESSKDYLTLLVYPDGLSSYQYYTDEFTSTEIKCDEGSNGFTISFSKNTDSVIIRLKNNIEPWNVRLSGNVNLTKKNSFSDFEESSSGWFHGKMSEDENVYTWIKFSSPADTIYITTDCTLNIHPVNYELSNLNEGNKYYIDRDYIPTTIPDEYKGLYMIKTANDDKANTNLDFHFNICSIADVYIAYDHRISPPLWITENYQNTGEKIYVTDTELGYFNIWKRSTQPGVITFGANGVGGESSMYFVFYKLYETLYADGGIFASGNTLTIKFKPSADITGAFTAGSFGIRWLTSLGAGVNLSGESSSFGYVNQGAKATDGTNTYYYIVYASTSNFPSATYTAGTEYTIMTVNVTGGVGTGSFELCPGGFEGDVGKWYIEIGGSNRANANSEFWYYAATTDAALPVELSSFIASFNSNNVSLNWKTATEVNNYGFEVERKANDNESVSWQKVGFVAANGNSNSPKDYSYIDKNITGGSKFAYRLKQVDNNGTFSYSDKVEVDVVPDKYELYQNYPNPFNPVTNIKFSLPEAAKVRIDIFNIIGENVKTLIDQNMEAGFHAVMFNAENLTSGTYIYRLQTESFTQIKKMLLLK